MECHLGDSDSALGALLTALRKASRTPQKGLDRPRGREELRMDISPTSIPVGEMGGWSLYSTDKFSSTCEKEAGRIHLSQTWTPSPRDKCCLFCMFWVICCAKIELPFYKVDKFSLIPVSLDNKSWVPFVDKSRTNAELIKFFSSICFSILMCA